MRHKLVRSIRACTYLAYSFTARTNMGEVRAGTPCARTRPLAIESVPDTRHNPARLVQRNLADHETSACKKHRIQKRRDESSSCDRIRHARDARQPTVGSRQQRGVRRLHTISHARDACFVALQLGQLAMITANNQKDNTLGGARHVCREALFAIPS